MSARDPLLDEVAKRLHEARIAFCWGASAVGGRDPWPRPGAKLPGDFGYDPIAYVDIAYAQAKAALSVVML